MVGGDSPVPKVLKTLKMALQCDFSIAHFALMFNRWDAYAILSHA